MKKLLVLLCAAILFATYAQAQSPYSSPTASGSTASASTNTKTSGTVTDYTPGAAIVLDTGTGAPVHFLIGKTVQVVTPDGKVVEAGRVKKDAKVHVHLVQEGNQTLVDKITVEAE